MKDCEQKEALNQLAGYHRSDWLSSYDAIIPLLKSPWNSSKDFATKFVHALYELHKHPECDEADLAEALDDHHHSIWLALMTSTPSQLCEALLRATGKWKE